MEQHTDIRWIQRYSNFHKACGKAGTPIGD